MGSSHCCSQYLENKQSEIVLKIDDTEKSSRSSSKKQPVKESQTPSQKDKLVSRTNKCDEPATPGFAEGKSFGSKRPEQSNKDIQLVAEIVMNLDDKMDQQQQSPIQSMRSLRSKKKKDDSPICEFQPKNSLKSFDSKKIAKLKSLSEHRVKFEDEMKEEVDSQRSMSADNKSQKSILKQELKYSQFRKQKTQSDAESKKQVHFVIKK